MVTDQKAGKLRKLMKSERTLANAAAKASMDEKTARRHRDLRRLPSEVKAEHTRRTRPHPLAEVWDEVRDKLEVNAVRGTIPRIVAFSRPREGEYVLRHRSGDLCSRGE